MAAVMVKAKALSADHRHQIEPGHRPVARALCHERFDSVQAPAAKGLQGQEPPG